MPVSHRLANRPGMAGIIPELTHGVPCPGRGSFCPGNVKIDHRAWLLPPELLFLAQICTKSFVGTRLGLRPRLHWGSLQHSPRPISWFRGWAPGI